MLVLATIRYMFISFPEIFPPIRLFSPIFLLDFMEFSHLYFYSDPLSIRNSRVEPTLYIIDWQDPVPVPHHRHTATTKLFSIKSWYNPGLDVLTYDRDLLSLG